jgi:Phage-related minor tail protein
MAQSSFKLALQIGATVGQSFRSSVKGSQSQLNQLGSSINKLKGQQSAISKFEIAESNVGKARVAYNAATKDLSKLRRELASTDQPTEQLSQSFDTAKRKTERLSQQLGKQRDRLQRSRQALNQLGLSTRNLVADNTRLGLSVDRLSTKYRKLSHAIRAQQANKAKRADLRGQLFDAVALGATVVAPLKIAVDFEQSIAKLGAITRASDESLKGLEQTARQLGENTMFSASEAASAMTFLGMAGLLGNVGIQGSMAGTALRASFLRLSAPPKVAAKALANLGVEVKDLDGNLRSVPELLKELAQASEGLGSAERAEAIKQIFGQEASAGLTELLKQAGGGALDAYIQQLQKAEGAATTMAKKMSATTAGSLKRLGSALESVAISLGSLLLPTVAAGAELFAGMASWVSGAAQEYPFLTKVIVGATVGLVALKVTAIAGAYAFTFLKGGVLSLVTAYRVLSAGLALAKLGMVRLNILSALTAARMGIMTAAQWALNVAMTANPIGLIVAGVAALAGVAFVLIKYWEPIGEFFSGLWDGVKEVTGTAVDWLLGAIKLLLNPFRLLGTVWNSVSGLFGGEGDQAGSVQGKKNNKLATAAVGAALATQPVMALPDATVNALPQIEEVSATTHNQNTVSIDAPITIDASPGMDERAVANEVQKALEQRQARAESDRRSALFDQP